MRANFLQLNVIGTRLQDQGMFSSLFPNLKEQVKLLISYRHKYSEQAVNLLYFAFQNHYTM